MDQASLLDKLSALGAVEANVLSETDRWSETLFYIRT